MCTFITKIFIEIPPCGKKVILSTEFVLLDLNPPFYEVNQEVWKRPPAWRNFKNIFCVLSKYPKKPFRTEKSSIFNFQYVKEVWASGLFGVKNVKTTFGKTKNRYPEVAKGRLVTAQTHDWFRLCVYWKNFSWLYKEQIIECSTQL